ncbi:unnamed protein product [Calypogeia fissa]
MRVKRQKQVRRHVRFYKTCCGFREPFRVLCDGNFVHAVLAARVGSLQDALPALLGGSAKALVTRCVIAELKKLGEPFSGTVLAARRLDIAKCDHDPLLPAVDCMEAMVGTTNPDHYYVATQDIELRRKLRKVAGGAIIFLQNTGLILEPPSAVQISYARLSEGERLHLASREAKVLEERAKLKHAQVADGGAVGDPSVSSAAPVLSEEDQKIAEVKELLKLKRKRAKGPNPLSQKKKKTVTGGTLHQVPGKGENAADEPTRKRKRQRHRVRDKKSVGGAASA